MSGGLWIKTPTKRYDYCMTFISGLAANNGLLCIGDGNSFNEQGRLITNQEVKLFELSSTCVVMPDGGVMDNIYEIMEWFKSTLENLAIGNKNPSVIAKCIASTFKKARGIDKENPYGFIVAGIETLKDGEKGPILIRVDSSDWVPVQSEVPYLVGGLEEPSTSFIKNGFKNDFDKTLADVMQIAINAMKVAQEYHKEIGGKISLRVIKETGIERYSAMTLDALEDNIGNNEQETI